MKKNNARLLRWWIIFNLVVVTFIGFWYFDVYTWMWGIDRTKLSLIIMSLFALSTVYVGVQTYRTKFKNLSTHRGIDFIWFIAESLTTLGLIGTVAGFMFMLGDGFSNIDVANVEATKQVIKDMGVGMGTALITTLTGLSCSLLLKLQLVNIDDEEK